MFSPRWRNWSCSSWAERNSSSVSSRVEMAARWRVERTLPPVICAAPHRYVLHRTCASPPGGSRCVLARVVHRVDDDMGEVMVGQSVQHFAAGSLPGDHTGGLEDFQMLADQ